VTNPSHSYHMYFAPRWMGPHWNWVSALGLGAKKTTTTTQ